jgi:formylglycine-generating enzyme required for sulfatase activity
MKRHHLLTTLSLFTLAGVALAAPGCSADPAPPAQVVPAPGQLMVALTTDLVPGKDFDELRLVVSYDGRVNNRTSLTWTVTEGVVRGSVPLPATVAVVGRADATGPVTVRAQAYLDGLPRVLREARLMVPQAGAKLLRLDVSGLCFNHVVRVVGDEPKSDCSEGAACVLGSCEDSFVDVRSLPDYAPASVFGTANPGAKDASCLDVLGAFSGAFDAVPRLEGSRCVLRASDLLAPPVAADGGTASASDAGANDAGSADAGSRDAGAIDAPVVFSGNLAVRYAPNSPGFCTLDHCLVPLAASATVGWYVDGTRLVLPHAICENPQPRVVVQAQGPSLDGAHYACGEWHASSTGARSTNLRTPLVTNGSPCLEPRALCTEHRTTCGRLWVNDASCNVVRNVNCGTCFGGTEGMVLIPGGSFTYGAPDSDAEGGEDEKPQTRATLPSFWMDETEVTTTAYAECLAAGACTKGNSGGYCNMQANGLPIEGRERHPVNCIDWYQASAFCSWKGRRLPTEVEWEYEARGGAEGTRTYPWGEELPTPARACMSDQEDADLEKSCVVGTHPLGNSKHGLKDMSGNAWEWTSSVYDELGHGIVRDPENRTEKGGCWTTFWTPTDLEQRRHLRAAFRSYDSRGYRSRTVGFRCARDF